ncbi:hypothetical protein FQZ97_887400 [compost metagenome]
MMASSRTDFTSSGVISGFGFASAKTNGLGAILATMSFFSTPPADRPRNTSAPSMASESVRRAVFWANWILSSSISSVRPSYTTPARSVTQMFSRGIPSLTSKPRQARAAAPAPEVTSLIFFGSLPATFRPLKMAEPTTMAVPCWSSWKTGIFMRSRSLRST